MNDEDKWFEPVLELEGDIVEINEATLQANIALVKEERRVRRMRRMTMMIWNNHYLYVYFCYFVPCKGASLK